MSNIKFIAPVSIVLIFITAATMLHQSRKATHVYGSDDKSWTMVPGKLEDGTMGYCPMSSDDRFIFGGAYPTTLDDMRDQDGQRYINEVEVYSAYKGKGMYIVLRRDPAFVGIDPTWTTWTPELWNEIVKTQNLQAEVD